MYNNNYVKFMLQQMLLFCPEVAEHLTRFFGVASE